MKVLIFGASGAGTTTLANELEQVTSLYIWKQTHTIGKRLIPSTL